MPPIAPAQIDAVKHMTRGWRLVHPVACGSATLRPPRPGPGPITLKAETWLQLVRRRWVREAGHWDGETYYELTPAGHRAAARDGAVSGEVRYVAPLHLPNVLRQCLARDGIRSVEDAHELIRSGRFLRMSNPQAAQALLRAFTRPPD